VLELPYAGRHLSMIVFLPKTVDGLAEFEKALTTEKLADCLSSLKETEIDVTLPKFKVTAELSLKETLCALGMGLAFEKDRADFSGLDGRKDLYLSAVVHKAFVDVNEEGTEAAAATAATFTFVSGRIGGPVFRADHPFVFLIRDRRTGSVLFLGRLVNPQQAQ